MLILSETQVQGLIDIDELITALERAHIQYSTGKAVMPVRLVVPLPQIDGRITTMPGFLNEDKALGMKVVTYFQNNPKQNLPSILATIMLFSIETGKDDRRHGWRLHHRHPYRLRFGDGDQGFVESDGVSARGSRRRGPGQSAHPSSLPRAKITSYKNLQSIGYERDKS